MYQLLIRLLSPLIIMMIIRDAIKRHGGWQFIQQRLGFNYPKNSPDNHEDQAQRIWIHCASVGEVAAAEPLIKALLQKPNYSITVTSNTPTGYQTLQKRFGKKVQSGYCPVDWPFAVNHFLNQVNPQQLWLMETELWPNLLALSAKRQIKVQIVNGRLSDKTLKAPQWLLKSYRQALKHADKVLCRSESDKQRFIFLGSQPDITETLGNIKYGNLQNPPIQANLIDSEREFVVLASTHADEELEFCQRWLPLKRSELLVIVPRHSKRSNELVEQLTQFSNHIATLSDLTGQQTWDKNLQIIIVDQMGLLMALYQHCKLVIMGGSFVSKGGHNILEPASYGKAIITGPDMSDFIDESELLLSQNALIQSQDYQQLQPALIQLLDDADYRQQLGTNAKQVIQQQSRISDDYLKALDIQ